MKLRQHFLINVDDLSIEIYLNGAFVMSNGS